MEKLKKSQTILKDELLSAVVMRWVRRDDMTHNDSVNPINIHFEPDKRFLICNKDILRINLRTSSGSAIIGQITSYHYNHYFMTPVTLPPTPDV